MTLVFSEPTFEDRCGKCILLFNPVVCSRYKDMCKSYNGYFKDDDIIEDIIEEVELE
jgi:hypothetical protein